MKKIMMFLVCLIPFVLIFTIQITTTIVRKTTYVAVEKVSFELDYKEIIKDSDEPVYLDFSAKILPIVATNKNVIYSSSDESIATVDENGLISFIGFGEVTITAMSSESNLISDSCVFYVTDNKPHFIKLLNYPTTMDVNDVFYIRTEIIPKEALNKTVTYSSSNPDVLSVTPTGKLVAKSKGKSTITITTINDVKTEFEVDVLVPVSRIEIDESSYNSVVGKNRIKLPKINVYPVNASNVNISYASKNPDIAEIEDGFIVFKKSGRAIFVATSEDGGYQDEWSIYYTGGYVISAQFKNEYKQISDSYQKDKVLVNLLDTITYDPSDADISSNIIFESLNENVVKVVDNKLVVVGGGKAQVKLTATTENAPIIDSISVSISRDASEIVAEDYTSEEPVFKLNYSILPADHTNNISFLLGSNIATITNDGIISFVQQGLVAVTISANGSVQKTIIVSFIKSETEHITLTKTAEQVNVDYLDEFDFLFDVSLNLGVVSYSGFDGNILCYDSESGLFTALKGGETQVIANSDNGSVTINVKVYRAVENFELLTSDVVINGSETVVTAKKQIQFNCNVYPNDATNKLISFEVSDEDIATISTDGLLIFNKAGLVTITAKTSNNIEKKVTINSTFGLPESFELKQSSVVLSDINETFKIEISDNIKPADVDKSKLTPSFVVYNSLIASVDENGLVTALSKGSTTIAVQIGSTIKQFNVEVQVKAKQIKIYYKENEFLGGSIIGSTINLTSKVFPENANNQLVSWNIIEGDDIASVNGNGLVSWTGFGSIKVKAFVAGTDVACEIMITRKNVSNLSIFDKNDNDISPVLGNIKVIEIEPTDTENVILRVGIDEAEFIDPENFDYDSINVSYEKDEELTINSINNLGNGYYQIDKTINQNKILCVTITFSVDDVEASVKIQYNNLQGITLELKNEDDVLFGLEGKRVFATRNYDASTDTTNSNFKVKYTRKPADNSDKLYWFVDRYDIASISEDGILSVNPEIIRTETKITVVVSNKSNPNDENAITASYTYTFAGDERNAVNIYNQDDFNWALNSQWGMALQTSLGTSEDNTGETYSELTHMDYNYDSSSKTYSVYGKIWGNGHTLNFNFKSGIDISFYYNVRNTTIKGGNFSEDKDYNNVISLSGHATFEYNRFQQMEKVWTWSADGTVTVRNCLFKHASKVGLQIGAESIGITYLENTIFYDVAQAAIDYQSGKLYIKGIFDVYNFTSPDDFSVDISNLFSGSTAKTMIKKAYQSSEFERFVYKGNSSKVEDWQANVAIVMLPQMDGLTLASEPKQSEVWFWNEDKQDFVEISAGVESETGLNYERVSYDYQSGLPKKSHMVYMVLTPYNSSSDIQPNTVLNEAGESKIYSAEKKQVLGK